MTKDTVEVQVYDLFDMVCDAYVASLENPPYPIAFYLERIKNNAYGYLPAEKHADFDEYLNNKDYMPASNIILDTK